MPQLEPPQEGTTLKGRSGYVEELTLERLIQRYVPTEQTWQGLLEAHEQVLGRLWAQLVPLMGNAAARAIFDRTIQLARRRDSFTTLVQTAERNLELSALRAQAPQMESEALRAALTTLSQTLEWVIVGLIGPGIFLTLLGDVELELQHQKTEFPTHPQPEEPKQEDGKPFSE